MLRRVACVIGVFALFGCDQISVEDAGAMDSGSTLVDAGVDGGRSDAGTPDAGDVDAGDVDAGNVDAGVDAGLVDAGVIDAGVIDAGVIDAGVIDAGVIDAGVIDAGQPDAGPIDAGTCVDFGCMSGQCCAAACIDTMTSNTHCGGCNQPCAATAAGTTAQCSSGMCVTACAAGLFDCDGVASNGCESTSTCVCQPGSTQNCYSGTAGTSGVGTCRSGTATCAVTGLSYGSCVGEVIPTAEVCGDGMDNDCNGARDDSLDEDGDGYSVCDGDCCDSASCPNNLEIGPGAFEIAGNQVDDDCDGTVDGAPLTCDASLAVDSLSGSDAARAMGLCLFRTGQARNWGVVSASYTRTNGAGVPASAAHNLRTAFGTNNLPLEGSRMLVLSTGKAAPASAPDGDPGQNTSHGLTAGVPSDWLAANGGQIPRGPTCPNIAGGSTAFDPIMLQMTIRVPQNARSFSLRANYLSSDYAEYVCSPYLDQFVVLLSSVFTPSGTESPNPSHKNLAVESANLTTPLRTHFTQCINGTVGCAIDGVSSSYSACTSTSGLTGTGYDTAEAGSCDANSLRGGSTGWMNIAGNVVPGEQITLRIAVWDSGDGIGDSNVLLDQFQWSPVRVVPGG